MYPSLPHNPIENNEEMLTVEAIFLDPFLHHNDDDDVEWIMSQALLFTQNLFFPFCLFFLQVSQQPPTLHTPLVGVSLDIQVSVYLIQQVISII
jgi:hypothetical protein